MKRKRRIDPIRDALHCVRMLVAEGKPINDGSLVEIEKVLRQWHGGCGTYVQKSMDPAIRDSLVRSDRRSGLTRRAIALKYGISERTVGNILQNSAE